ncbi:hypothetical protein [Rhodococcus jostii]|uniref:hypothetical protein n=1 Tax=Rhodococcus jostii TaxID=132919 RepID=UPI0036497BEF
MACTRVLVVVTVAALGAGLAGSSAMAKSLFVGLLDPLASGSSSGSAGPPPGPGTDAVTAACANQLRSIDRGPIQDGALNEISAITAGVRNPGLYWVHNDSGDSARIFALDQDGAVKHTYSLAGAGAQDWEDIAIGGGPVAGRSYLYVGDIGDNARQRREVVVYRVPEPTVTGSGTETLKDVDVLRLQYPDGAHNAEAMLVDPLTGELVIIEKTENGGPARVYRAPAGLVAGSVTTLDLVTTLTVPAGSSNLVTGADVSADGRELAVRTYGGVLLWHRDLTSSLWGAWSSPPCSGPQPEESQGEAIAFYPDGRGYVTVGEGAHQYLHNFVAP